MNKNIMIALIVVFSCIQVSLAANSHHQYDYTYTLKGETYYCKSNGTCITSTEKVNRDWAYQQGMSNSIGQDVIIEENDSNGNLVKINGEEVNQPKMKCIDKYGSINGLLDLVGDIIFFRGVSCGK